MSGKPRVIDLDLAAYFDMMRVRKRSGFGWKRRSREWLYTTLGLFSDYRVRHGATA